MAAKRTPFGAFGGKLKDKTITDLAEIAARATLTAANVPPEAVQHVIMGNVAPTTSDSPYMPRHAALRVGIPKEVPAFAVNRLCGSGFQVFQLASISCILIAEVENLLLVGDRERCNGNSCWCSRSSVVRRLGKHVVGTLHAQWSYAIRYEARRELDAGGHSVEHTDRSASKVTDGHHCGEPGSAVQDHSSRLR